MLGGCGLSLFIAPSETAERRELRSETDAWAEEWLIFAGKREPMLPYRLHKSYGIYYPTSLHTRRSSPQRRQRLRQPHDGGTAG